MNLKKNNIFRAVTGLCIQPKFGDYLKDETLRSIHRHYYIKLGDVVGDPIDFK